MISLSTNPCTPIYALCTPASKPGRDDAVYIHDKQRVVASVQQHDIFPDKVTFYEGGEGEADGKVKVSVNKLLKRGTLPDK